MSAGLLPSNIVHTFSPAGTGAADATYVYPYEEGQGSGATPNNLAWGQMGGYDRIEVAVKPTAAPAGSPTTPKLDVTIEGSIDAGTNWFTIATVAQITTGTTLVQTQAVRTASVSLGSRWRIKALVETASGTATYTNLAVAILATASQG